MKKFLFLSVFSLFSCIAFAQPYVYTGGSFNSQAKGGGSATDTIIYQWQASDMPLYTATTVVTNTATATFHQKTLGALETVYTWINVTSLTGTNTSCTIKLQGYGDTSIYGGTPTTLQTWTVTATGEYNYKIDKNPYSSLKWIFTGSGTHTTGIYGGILPRPFPILNTR